MPRLNHRSLTPPLVDLSSKRDALSMPFDELPIIEPKSWSGPAVEGFTHAAHMTARNQDAWAAYQRTRPLSLPACICGPSGSESHHAIVTGDHVARCPRGDRETKATQKLASIPAEFRKPASYARRARLTNPFIDGGAK